MALTEANGFGCEPSWAIGCGHVGIGRGFSGFGCDTLSWHCVCSVDYGRAGQTVSNCVWRDHVFPFPT